MTMKARIGLVRTAVGCMYGGMAISIAGAATAIATKDLTWIDVGTGSGVGAVIAGGGAGIASGFAPPKAVLGHESIRAQVEREQRTL
jgi:hypothetical protein